MLGRFYPWQNDDVALYLQLGLGADVPERDLVEHGDDEQRRRGPGLDHLLRGNRRGSGSAGARASTWRSPASSSSSARSGSITCGSAAAQIDSCAAGIGPSTFLATRFGFALATGRQKPPPPPAPPPPPSDRDGDAILDSVDACPDQAGLPSTDPTKNGCPPPSDRDHDGIPDAADACPDQAGPPSDDPKRNGCPDKDGDKIIDSLDACPDVPGVASEDPKKNGCPPDTDGDGITDDKDACPNEKGLPNEDPSKNGCPLVVVRDKEIVIGEQVQFDLDKSTIKPASDGLLDTVAGVMKDPPRDPQDRGAGPHRQHGQTAHNKELCRQPAPTSVKRALVKRGVAERRLVADRLRRKRSPSPTTAPTPAAPGTAGCSSSSSSARRCRPRRLRWPRRRLGTPSRRLGTPSRRRRLTTDTVPLQSARGRRYHRRSGRLSRRRRGVT